MYRIAICDDEISYLLLLEKITRDFCCEHSIPSEILLYEKSNLLLYDIQDNKNYFDIFLLDIEMPKITGMELAHHIKKCCLNAIVVFITSHDKYAIDSFELSIFRYIQKASLNTRLPIVLKDSFNHLFLQENHYYLLLKSTNYNKILYKEIVYIYKEQKNTIFVLLNGSEKIRKSLFQVYSELNQDDFIFIDRGYIVNILYIKNLDNNNLILKTGTQLPISHSHIKQVKKALTLFWGNNI